MLMGLQAVHFSTLPNFPLRAAWKPEVNRSD